MWNDRSAVRVSLLAGVGTIAALAIGLGTRVAHREPATSDTMLQGALDQQREPDPLAVLERLADRYLEEGKTGLAIGAYQQLIAEAPAHRHVCLWRYDVAHAALTSPASTNADKVAKIEDLVRTWKSSGRMLPDADRQACHDNAAAMSGDLARAYHAEAAKSSGETLVYAERLYAAFLDAFPDAPDFAVTQYYHAELLWTLADRAGNKRVQVARWDRAADAYGDVLATHKVEPKLRKEAGYAAVLARKNAAGEMPVGEAATDALSAREERLVAACDRYIADVADLHDDDLVSMKFIEAKIYRRHRRFEDAIVRFREILEHRRDHETAEMSAHLLLDLYDQLDRRSDRVALAASLRADGAFLAGKPDLARRLAR